jgi:hypothetical protein
VQPPSDVVTVVVRPSLLVDTLLAALPPAVLLTAPPPLLTETPLSPRPTVVCPDTLPLPAEIEVDMPPGGLSPGFRCTTLHPFEVEFALTSPAANAGAVKPAASRAAAINDGFFILRSC